MNKETIKLKRKISYKRTIEDSWRLHKKEIPNYIAFNKETLELTLERGYIADSGLRHNLNYELISPVGLPSEQKYISRTSKKIYGFDMW